MLLVRRILMSDEFYKSRLLSALPPQDMRPGKSSWGFPAKWRHHPIERHFSRQMTSSMHGAEISRQTSFSDLLVCRVYELVCRRCHESVRTPLWCAHTCEEKNEYWICLKKYLFLKKITLKHVSTKYIFKKITLNKCFYIIKNCSYIMVKSFKYFYTLNQRQLQNVACPHSKVMFDANGVERRSSMQFLCKVVRQQLVFRSVSLFIFLAKQRKQNSS